MAEEHKRPAVKKKPLEMHVAKPGDEAKDFRKGSRKKQQTSRFLVTINTNQSTDAHKEVILQCVQAMNEEIEQFIKFVEPGGSFALIDEVALKAVVEKGKKFRKWHCHVIVAIKHRTRVQLKIDHLRECWKDGLDLDSIHLNVRYASDAGANLEDYLTKSISMED